MLTIRELNNLQLVAKEAVICEYNTGLPAEITIAQWALESGWGAHSPGNNCFGIKEYVGCPGRQLLHTRENFTQEQLEKWLMAKSGRTAKMENSATNPPTYHCQDWFASFPTLSACFVKHAAIFTKSKYVTFMEAYRSDHNLINLIHGISPIYATDPDYSRKLLSIISEPEIRDAITEAKRQ